jgi:3-phosphoshikimate 1-carboxyvinyltransferase
VKESDRVTATADVLRAFGVQLEERPDGMLVRGGSQLHAGHAASIGDHRLAMLAAVAGMLADNESVVSGAGAVAVSYPEFWGHLARLGAVGDANPG